MDKKTAMKTDEITIIFWKDAISIDPWTHISEIEPIYHTIQTIGVLIKENDDSVTVGLNRDLLTDNFSCFIHIPKEMITFRKTIKGVSVGKNIIPS